MKLLFYLQIRLQKVYSIGQEGSNFQISSKLVSDMRWHLSAFAHKSILRVQSQETNSVRDRYWNGTIILKMRNCLQCLNNQNYFLHHMMNEFNRNNFTAPEKHKQNFTNTYY